MFEPSKNILDEYELNRELDKVKAQVFQGSNSAFLGPLLCTQEFIWTDDTPTAATNGLTVWWNPVWFMKLEPKVRQTVLLHELWHTARMHMVRIGDRKPKEWNWACDIRINNDLENMGYSFDGTYPWKDQNFGEQPEEDIYDAIIARNQQMPNGPWGNEPEDIDLIPVEDKDSHNILQNVVQATQAAKRSGNAGSIPGDVETMVNKFLAPIIPWERELNRFFTDLSEEIYSWKRPNRRYQDIYLPSLVEEEGRLDHLIYYLDVSGSISDNEIIRFNSEVKFIKERLNPRKLSLVQFDTRITKEDVFEEHDSFEAIKVVGRGGTDLRAVRNHILKHTPTAAVVFSDLYCPVMSMTGITTPVIWVSVNNKSATVERGKIIHIKG